MSVMDNSLRVYAAEYLASRKMVSGNELGGTWCVGHRLCANLVRLGIIAVACDVVVVLACGG